MSTRGNKREEREDKTKRGSAGVCKHGMTRIVNLPGVLFKQVGLIFDDWKTSIQQLSRSPFEVWRLDSVGGTLYHDDRIVRE